MSGFVLLSLDTLAFWFSVHCTGLSWSALRFTVVIFLSDALIVCDTVDRAVVFKELVADKGMAYMFDSVSATSQICGNRWSIDQALFTRQRARYALLPGIIACVFISN